jgi:hypothetical protein
LRAKRSNPVGPASHKLPVCGPDAMKNRRNYLTSFGQPAILKAAGVARMSEATSGVGLPDHHGPAYRYAHAGYLLA